MISQFAVHLPIGCAARLICHTFCLIPLNHTIFQFLINPRGFNSFYSHFLNGWMLISNLNKQFQQCVKCSIWLHLITHHRPTNILYLFNIRITTKVIVWPLIHYIRPSLWNLVFSRYGYYIAITTSAGFGYCFKVNICSISKDVINIWWFHSCAVCNYTGRLTDNLNQVAGTGYSLKLFLEWVAWKNIPLFITYIIKHFTHVTQIMTVSTWWSITSTVRDEILRSSNLYRNVVMNINNTSHWHLYIFCKSYNLVLLPLYHQRYYRSECQR